MTSQANLLAGQAVVRSRVRHRRGLIRSATGALQQPLSVREAAKRYRGSNRGSISRVIKRLEAANTLDASELVDGIVGRPRLLTDEEEEAIVSFVIWMDRSGLPAAKYEIEDAANTLRRRRDPEAEPLSKMWYSRFRDNHPELQKSILKAGEVSRAEYESAGIEETKEWFQRLREKLRDALRKGKLTFNRRDFAGAFQEIFNEGFTTAHIIRGFEKSGIFPPTPEPAVTYLMKQKLKKKQAVNPAFSSLLPPEARFTLASDTAKRVGERYHDILSSPTIQGLKHIKNIVSEAILLEQVVESHVDDRRARIEKRYNQRKRGKRGKTIGDYFLNISLHDLRDQQTEFLADGEKKDIRQQLRLARSLAIRELDAIKKEWRENREVTIEGLPKRLQFKQWLEYTGKDVEYYSIDENRADMSRKLSQKEEFFTIDTQRAPEVNESIRNARFAAKPLSAVDLSRLNHSDDTVDFNLTQPHAYTDSEHEDNLNEFSDLDEVAMPSSPPCLPDYESLPESLSESPLPYSTPCPTQH
ncbi:transposase [Fusarium langsethiae]|uniref:Transposase n=1 Tax=Fusarium langsethiae TaxID=179993 RepID=A0A0M9ENV8_FUSLA|nr:transposase [Fusarium langsethiae]